MITLYLMTKKGFRVLETLLKNNLKWSISTVIVGRDDHLDDDYAEKIISHCKKENIKYVERNGDFTESEYSIAIAWRWLIRTDSKLIVLHDSPLPKYRGFSPLPNMLINQEPEIGVTAIFAGQEYDKGDIIAQSTTKITYPISISEAIDLICGNYSGVILYLVNRILQRKDIVSRKQDESRATYSLWRDDDDYLIDWNKDSNDVLNFINAVSSPYKGALAYTGDRKVRILQAELAGDVVIHNRNSNIGKVIQAGPVVVCGSGLIRLLNVVDDRTRYQLLPFKKIRIRFTPCNRLF